jgi:hypothetical protein
MLRYTRRKYIKGKIRRTKLLTYLYIKGKNIILYFPRELLMPFFKLHYRSKIQYSLYTQTQNYSIFTHTLIQVLPQFSEIVYLAWVGGSCVVGRASWVVRRGSCVVGRASCVVGRASVIRKKI